jgi:hypothetical protein
MMNVYMVDRCEVRRSFTDEFGSKTATMATPYKCRIIESNKLVTSFTSEQVVSTARVTLPATADVIETDTVWFKGKSHKIIGITLEKDFRDRSIVVSVA